VANPLFVALPTFLIVALHTAPSWQEAVLWWIVTAFGISVALLLFIYQGVRRGRYSDHHLSVRTQRLVPLVVGLLCAVIALILLLVLQASQTLLAAVAAVLVCGICTLAITARWRHLHARHYGSLEDQFSSRRCSWRCRCAHAPFQDNGSITDPIRGDSRMGALARRRSYRRPGESWDGIGSSGNGCNVS